MSVRAYLFEHEHLEGSILHELVILVGSESLSHIGIEMEIDIVLYDVLYDAY